MNELITISDRPIGEGSIPTVNARDLHVFLESKQQFADWIKNRIKKYGFSDGVDFLSVHKIMNGAQSTDYHLSIDMAKELSMVERNAKGKQARAYFIECEHVALMNTRSLPTNYKEALQHLLEKVEENECLQLQIATDRPKTIFADAVTASHTSILVGELAKLLKQNGIDIGQNRLFEWLRENGYLIKRAGTDRNMPTQRSMELGILEIKERTISEPNGSVRITRTTKVTGKGQLYFINKFIEERDQAKAA